jgi:hypothetical protein
MTLFFRRRVVAKKLRMKLWSDGKRQKWKSGLALHTITHCVEIALRAAD